MGCLTGWRRLVPCIGVGLAIWLGAPIAARAGGGGHNVVLIVDPEDPNSTYIANYYRNARGVPERNIFYFKPGTSDYATFVTDKLDSLFGMLATREISDHADFVLIMPTNQYRVSAPSLVQDSCVAVSNFSLASCYIMANIAASVQAGTLFSTEPNQFAPTGTTSSPVSFHANNGYFNGSVNFSPNAKKYFLAAMLGYTGANGNSVSEITALIDRSVAADFTRIAGQSPAPKTFYYCRTSDCARDKPRDGTGACSVPVTPVPYGSAISAINSFLNDATSSSAVAIDMTTSAFACPNWLPPNGTTNCMGIMTGAAFPCILTQGITVQAGAFCDSLTSYAGTFDDTSQEKMSAWIRLGNSTNGACGTFGTVEEPCNFYQKFPDPRVHAYYVKQLTLGEACFRSLAAVPFQGLIYGDILCQPFSFPPSITLPTPANPADLSQVSGTISLTPTVSTSRPGAAIGSVKLYLNGKFHSTISAGGSFTVDTTALPEGYNEFRAVAFDNTTTENQFKAIRTYNVNNLGRSATISSVTPSTGGRGTLFAITVNAAGGTLRELRLMANGRVFAASPSAPATFNLYGEMLGAGPVSLTAVAEFTDGVVAQSLAQPLSIAFDAAPGNGPQTAAPTAYSFSKDLPANKPFILELPAADPDTTTLTYTVTQNPSQATISGTGRTRLVRPTALASGQDTLIFTANDGSSNSATATITLRYNAPPLTFAQQPAGTTACAGSLVTFSVSMSGTGPFTYQWQKDGGNLSGQTGSTLSLSSVTTNNAGSYACVVTGPLRASLSNPAVLTVLTTTPSVSSQPSSLTVCPNKPASFSVVSPGPAPLSYQWQKNTIDIPAATQPSYLIASASTNDAGSYLCNITNVCGATPSNPATLTVSLLFGDMNGDCVVNAADVTIFVNVLLGLDTNPTDMQRADLNGDTRVDGQDVQLFVNLIH